MWIATAVKKKIMGEPPSEKMPAAVDIHDGAKSAEEPRAKANAPSGKTKDATGYDVDDAAPAAMAAAVGASANDDASETHPPDGGENAHKQAKEAVAGGNNNGEETPAVAEAEPQAAAVLEVEDSKLQAKTDGGSDEEEDDGAAGVDGGGQGSLLQWRLRMQYRGEVHRLGEAKFVLTRRGLERIEDIDANITHLEQPFKDHPLKSQLTVTAFRQKVILSFLYATGAVKYTKGIVNKEASSRSFGFVEWWHPEYWDQTEWNSRLCPETNDDWEIGRIEMMETAVSALDVNLPKYIDATTDADIVEIIGAAYKEAMMEMMAWSDVVNLRDTPSPTPSPMSESLTQSKRKIVTKGEGGGAEITPKRQRTQTKFTVYPNRGTPADSISPETTKGPKKKKSLKKTPSKKKNAKEATKPSAIMDWQHLTSAIGSLLTKQQVTELKRVEVSPHQFGLTMSLFPSPMKIDDNATKWANPHFQIGVMEKMSKTIEANADLKDKGTEAMHSMKVAVQRPGRYSALHAFCKDVYDPPKMQPTKVLGRASKQPRRGSTYGALGQGHLATHFGRVIFDTTIRTTLRNRNTSGNIWNPHFDTRTKQNFPDGLKGLNIYDLDTNSVVVGINKSVLDTYTHSEFARRTVGGDEIKANVGEVRRDYVPTSMHDCPEMIQVLPISRGGVLSQRGMARGCMLTGTHDVSRDLEEPLSDVEDSAVKEGDVLYVVGEGVRIVLDKLAMIPVHALETGCLGPLKAYLKCPIVDIDLYVNRPVQAVVVSPPADPTPESSKTKGVDYRLGPFEDSPSVRGAAIGMFLDGPMVNVRRDCNDDIEPLILVQINTSDTDKKMHIDRDCPYVKVVKEGDSNKSYVRNLLDELHNAKYGQLIEEGGTVTSEDAENDKEGSSSDESADGVDGNN